MNPALIDPRRMALTTGDLESLPNHNFLERNSNPVYRPLAEMETARVRFSAVGSLNNMKKERANPQKKPARANLPRRVLVITHLQYLMGKSCNEPSRVDIPREERLMYSFGQNRDLRRLGV